MNSSLKKTASDLQELKDEVLCLLGATAETADERVKEARKKLHNSLESAGDAYEQGVECAHKFVKGHPVESAIIACLAGVVVGWALTRGDGHKSHFWNH